jgi:hypothetical protein
MNLTRIYRLLLGLYPTDQREQFGAEMESVFREAAGSGGAGDLLSTQRLRFASSPGYWLEPQPPGWGSLCAARRPATQSWNRSCCPTMCARWSGSSA